MVYPNDEETFDARNTPEFIREGHLNSIQQFLKRIQDFLGYGGRLSDKFGIIVPPGVMFEWPDVAAPSGFLLCDGKSYSRTHADYVDLFNVIGTKYGALTGSVFSVPDRRGLFTRGYCKIPTISFVPGDVDIGTDRIGLTAQAFNRGALPVRFTTDDTLPPPFLINTTYYTIYDGSDDVGFATTRANAIALTKINITGIGAGTSYVHPYLEEDKDSRLKSAYGGNDGEDLGSYQPDAFQGHWHYVYDSGTGLYYDNDGPDGAGAQTMKIHAGQPGASSRGGPLATDPAYGAYRVSVETRPRNVNVNYIIKR